MTSKAQQIELDNAQVAPENCRVIGKCNMRINPGMKPKEPTYQVVLDALALTTCYPAFLITVEVPVIYMHQDILKICLRIPGQEFDEPPTEDEALSFIRELGHSREIKYITDVIVDHLDKKKKFDLNLEIFRYIFHICPRVHWSKLLMNFLEEDIMSFFKELGHTGKSIIRRDFFCFIRCINIEEVLLLSSTEVYLERHSVLTSFDSPSKKKFAKAKKVAATKPKPTKKKAPIKADRGKGLNVLSEVSFLKLLNSRRLPNEARKISIFLMQVAQVMELILNQGFLMSNIARLWGNSGEKDDDDEIDYEDESDNGDNDDDGNDNDDGNDGDGDDDDDDANDDDNQEDDDTNDDDEETDSDRTKREEKIDEEERIDDEEKMDKEEDDEVTKELYNDVNVNLGNRDADMTNADEGGADQQNVSQESGFGQVEEDVHVTLTPVRNTQKTDGPIQSSFVSTNFTSKLLNLENPSLADNEITSLMDTTVRHEEPGIQTSSLYTVPIMAVPPPPPFFNPLLQQATPTSTPTTSEATTSFPSLPDFLFVFKFNDRVTNLEKDLSEIKKVDQYAQALSSIPAIAHNFDCREEAQAEKRDYIELVDTSMRAILKEEVNTQRHQILPQEVLNFTIPVIEKNVIESSEAAVLERELYDALVKSYQTDKDLFDTYGEVFTLKRSRDDRDKDQDPSAGSDRETKIRKSSKEAESSRDSRSKEKKSSSTSKDASHSQHKPSSKSSHVEEPSHTVDDSGTWISQVARAEEPRTSFDELMDTSFDFSTFVLNWLNIKDLTQEIVVGPSFELLKGTCKSLTKLEYHLEECSKATTERLEWHNPEGKSYLFDLSKPLPLIPDHQGRQVIPQDYFINNDLEYLKGGDLSRRYSTFVTKTKVATYEIKWIEDLVCNLWSPVKVIYDKHAYLGTSHWVEVCREDQQLYKFIEGNFTRLRLQDIEDMLLLLVQHKLTNLIIDERYDLNVALRMFTKRIVIQRRVEDLQLGVKSYQKKLNLTKPDTFRSNLRNRTTYTTYSDPKEVIYKDQNNKNRLMRADELHKFSDGTLNDVRTALHDIASGIRMEYLPKRKWCRLDKRRARVMVQDIDKQLYERRLVQNLEKFVGGREYGNDLRLLERTI
ncbi:retrovirus-related pol polyprotein from transposon TNT 1-94 [Tanacetum coccineum]